MKRRYLWMVRRAYKAMRHPKLRHRVWWQKLTKPMMDKRLWRPCRDTVARGLAIGLFFSVLPLPQSAVAGLTAMWARANVPIAVAATWISNPLTNVPLWAFQLWLGDWIQKHVAFTGLEIPKFAGGHVANFMVGAAALAILLGLMAFPIVHLFSALMPHHLPIRKHLPRRADISPAVPKSPAS